jgi:hypothetical protein
MREEAMPRRGMGLVYGRNLHTHGHRAPRVLCLIIQRHANLPNARGSTTGELRDSSTTCKKTILRLRASAA